MAWYVPGVGALAGVPFVAAVLADHHVSDAQIATVFLLQPLGALFAGPAWAWVADRSGHTRPILVITCAMSAIGLGMIAIPAGLAAATVAIGLYAATRAPQAPMVDAIAVRALPDGARRYGRVRLWGSVAFLVVAGLGGPLRTVWGPAPVVLAAALLGLAAVTSARLPDLVAVPRRPAAREVVALLAGRDASLLALACVLHGVGLVYYNTFFARHVEVLGLSSAVTGAALVAAVTVEVAVMAVAPRVLGLARPAWLLAVAFAASAPRWLGTAWATDPIALVALQALHGLSFGLFWVAAVPAFARRAPAHLARSAQALLPATAFGVGPLLGLLIGRVVLADRPPAALFIVGAGAAAVAALTVLGVRPLEGAATEGP